MARTIAIGAQDFGAMIANNSFYVDKTYFIKDWWENLDTVTLITRPRRFGKTLTMNMLDYFFSINHAGREDLFENLSIWEDEKYRKLQGTYPVIFLSFAGVKGNDYETVRKMICQLIVNLYMDYDFLLKSGFLEGEDASFFRRMSVEMDDADAVGSLGQLSRYLFKYYGKKVIILLDEYDTPMQEAYVNGFWDQLTDFIRRLFNSAFKINVYLERAVLTGITRVSKESVFSELNHSAVVTTTTRMYETVFGFTENEVLKALEEFGLQDQAPDVKYWYDGFRFGDHDCIYNPWSIIHFLKYKEFAAYWANTSSNKLVGRLIQKGSPNVKVVMEDLINQKSFRTNIDEQMVFDQLDKSEHAIWSLLLASGYLKVTDHTVNKRGKKEYVLDIVNLEVRRMFEDMFQNWFSACDSDYNDFVKALLMNDVKMINTYMNKVTRNVISYFDSGNQPSEKTEPERFFHGLVLGLMIELEERYVMTSNRESGFGRYDVLLKPRNRTDDGVILEFKVFDSGEESDLADTVDAAICQIIDKKYAAVLEAEGISREKIRIYGFAFQGKSVQIDGGYLAELEEDL